MKASDKTNPALLIDPKQWYEVDYTIDQSGNKHKGKTLLQGKDLTEKQIISIIEKVSLKQIL